MSGKADMEKGEEMVKLLPKQQADVVDEIMAEPVGGNPGNPMFWTNMQMSARCTLFAFLLASVAWVPAANELVHRFMPGVPGMMPLAICMFIFSVHPILGNAVGNGAALVVGTFAACCNMFVLRGFFPEGVGAGMSHFSTPGLIGWADLMIFNFVFLSTNIRMGTRMAALSSNTGFMLAFLNPADTSRFSKGFEIDMEGTAVATLCAMVVSALGAVLVMVLPYPWNFASRDMKTRAKQASIDTAQQFIRSVEYYNRAKPSVMVEQLLTNTEQLKKELDATSSSIEGAWFEGFDIGNAGQVRHLMEKHVAALKRVFDILHQLQMAMSTEVFGATHQAVVAMCGPSAHLLAEKTGVLLFSVTEAASDGDLSESEKHDLLTIAAEVKSALKKLSSDYDTARRKNNMPPVHKDLLHTAHFFFALSAYARLVIEYTDMLCNSPPSGVSFVEAVTTGFKNIFVWTREYHGRFMTRYWVALLLSFVFAVRFDNYGGACAVTGCFLLNERIGADMMAILNVVLSVVVSSVIGGLIYSYSCMTGYGEIVMPIVVGLYLMVTLNIAFSGSSFSLIGIFMAALAPFQMVKLCPAEVGDDTAGAVGLWVGIRGCLIAMTIFSTCEYASIPGEQAGMAVKRLDAAMEALQAAFLELWADKEPKSCDLVGPLLAEASTFNLGARLEPRGARTRWRFALMDELIGSVNKLRLDILSIRHGVEGQCGSDSGTTQHAFAILHKVEIQASPRQSERGYGTGKISALNVMVEDLRGTLEDSREIAKALLSHKSGPLDIVHKLHQAEGVDELDGLSSTIENINKVEGVKFPAKAPDSLEEDDLCQLAIVLLMLGYTVDHIADTIKSCIRHTGS